MPQPVLACRCPHCFQKKNFRKVSLGRVTTCPACRKNYLIPERPSEWEGFWALFQEPATVSGVPLARESAVPVVDFDDEPERGQTEGSASHAARTLFSLLGFGLSLFVCAGCMGIFNRNPSERSAPPSKAKAQGEADAQLWTVDFKPAWARKALSAELAPHLAFMDNLIEIQLKGGQLKSLSVNPNVVSFDGSFWREQPKKTQEGNVASYALYFEARGFPGDVEIRDSRPGANSELILSFSRSEGRVIWPSADPIVVIPPRAEPPQATGEGPDIPLRILRARQQEEQSRRATAEANLQTAKRLLKTGSRSTAQKLLRELIAGWPETDAAQQAQDILASLPHPTGKLKSDPKPVPKPTPAEEAAASEQLKLARVRVLTGDLVQARLLLRAILKSYPATEAAEEAERLLLQIK